MLACVCDMSELVVSPHHHRGPGHGAVSSVGVQAWDYAGRVSVRAKVSTCVLQINVHPPAVWACAFCLSALWASLHGSGLMGWVCVWVLQNHSDFLNVTVL